jgi:hypothetical protein
MDTTSILTIAATLIFISGLAWYRLGRPGFQPSRSRASHRALRSRPKASIADAVYGDVVELPVAARWGGGIRRSSAATGVAQETSDIAHREATSK